MIAILLISAGLFSPAILVIYAPLVLSSSFSRQEEAEQDVRRA